MNKLDALEDRLRCWKPRGPSARLRAELFPGTDEPRSLPAGRVFGSRAGTVTSLGVAMVASLMLVTQRAPEILSLAGGSGSAGILAAAFSNQLYAAYLPASHHSLQNRSPLYPLSATPALAAHAADPNPALPMTTNRVQR